MTNWGLTTCRTRDLDHDVAAIRRSDRSIVIPDVLRPYPGLSAALEDWEKIGPLLRDVESDDLEPVDADETLSLRHPRKLICAGANYRDHVAEMGTTTLPEGVQPFFFLVPPTTTMIGDGEPILLPEAVGTDVDWEAELAVVIGRRGHRIDPETALEHVAGYACFNDVTARALLLREVAIAPPFKFDWAASKGQDTFCPTGAVTPAWQIPDPGDLSIRCYVNGTLKQDGTTANLISSIPELIAAASRTWTLEPGDVIATGTPAGVGHSRGEHLADGDEVLVEISGLLPLRNPVRRRP